MRVAVVRSGLCSDSFRLIHAGELEAGLAFHDGAVGDAPGGGHAARHAGGIALGGEAADRDRALASA